jgi:hypothetical protein
VRDVELVAIGSYMSADVRGVCLYWVYHVKQSNARITDDHQAYLFLKRHFLHWLEAFKSSGKDIREHRYDQQLVGSHQRRSC